VGQFDCGSPDSMGAALNALSYEEKIALFTGLGPGRTFAPATLGTPELPSLVRGSRAATARPARSDSSCAGEPP
jgi:hypothetical protein